MRIAITRQRNLRIQLVMALLVIAIGLIFRIHVVEIGLVSILIVLVICAEMINTVVEEVVDLVTKEHRKEAKIAKNVSAGMVLIVSLATLLIGLSIFLPYGIALLESWL